MQNNIHLLQHELIIATDPADLINRKALLYPLGMDVVTCVDPELCSDSFTH